MDTRSILNTKLYKPEVKDQYVLRENIIEKLEQNRDKNLTIVIAPTGYGKSITISQWLNQTKAKSCWITADDTLNNFRTFLLYFVTSVKSIFTDSFEELSNFLENIKLPPDNVISNTLINELDEIGEDLILVLDDYYFIKNSQIHNLIHELLKYPPVKFHLVIISRRDPPLNLSTLRCYDKLNHIRMKDLRFNRNEATNLVDKTTDIKVNDQSLDIILEETEGWVVGLRLAFLALKNGLEVEKSIEELRGDKHYLSEHLLNEVFLKSDDNIQKILLTASLFRRFNKGLLKELINFENNKDTIDPETFFNDLFDRFRKSTLFIIPLDNNGIWFRYHHFFKDFLLKKLMKESSKSKINEWRKKAGEYFEKNELFDEAIQQALSAGDINQAANIIEKNRHQFIDTDQFSPFINWIDELPEGTIDKHPGILLTRAMLRENIRDLDGIKSDLIVAEKLIADKSDNDPDYQQLVGEFHFVHCILDFNLRNYKDAFANSEKALKLLTYKSQYLKSYCLALQLWALNGLGKFDDSVKIINGIIDSIPLSESIKLNYNLITQAMLYSYRGKLKEIEESSQKICTISNDYKMWVSLSYGTYYLGDTHYQWNDLDTAVKYTEKLGDHYYGARPGWSLRTLYVKAFAFLALDKDTELAETMEEIRRLTQITGSDSYNELTKAFEVELALRQNDIRKVSEIANTTNYDALSLEFNFYFPQLTQIKFLMVSDHISNTVQIERLIDKYIGIGRSDHKYNLLMQVLLLQSIHLKYQGKNESAIESLKEALGLAEPGGFIRIFVDLGEPMKKLVEEYHKIEPQNNYVSKLVKAFTDEKLRRQKLQQMDDRIFSTSISEFDNLSSQEIKLLNLVAQGYRNKEIAESLYLSPNSVKKYLYDVYHKLGVGNRVAAVSSARELGLIKQLG